MYSLSRAGLRLQGVVKNKAHDVSQGFIVLKYLEVFILLVRVNGNLLWLGEGERSSCQQETGFSKSTYLGSSRRGEAAEGTGMKVGGSGEGQGVCASISLIAAGPTPNFYCSRPSNAQGS